MPSIRRLCWIHFALGVALMSSVRAAPDGDVEWLGAVQAADDARVEAMMHPDREALGVLLADELRYSHSNGNVDTKESFMEALTSGKSKYAAIQYTERQFTLVAPTIVLMTGRADFHLGSADAPAMGLGFLGVWRLEAGQWRFLAWQSFRLPTDERPDGR